MTKVETIDLSNDPQLKKKREYDLNDRLIMTIKTENNLRASIIENDKGKFVDIRKYYNDYPTKKGVRMDCALFKQVAEKLNKINKIKQK